MVSFNDLTKAHYLFDPKSPLLLNENGAKVISEKLRQNIEEGTAVIVFTSKQDQSGCFIKIEGNGTFVEGDTDIFLEPGTSGERK